MLACFTHLCAFVLVYVVFRGPGCVVLCVGRCARECFSAAVCFSLRLRTSDDLAEAKAPDPTHLTIHPFPSFLPMSKKASGAAAATHPHAADPPFDERKLRPIHEAIDDGSHRERDTNR